MYTKQNQVREEKKSPRKNYVGTASSYRLRKGKSGVSNVFMGCASPAAESPTHPLSLGGVHLSIEGIAGHRWPSQHPHSPGAVSAAVPPL